MVHVALSQQSSRNNGIRRFGTAASALEETPIAPPVQVKYTQLLIDGQFVNATFRKFQISPKFN